MAHFYSPSVGGFFASEICGSNMPSDALPVSDATYTTLLAAQTTGMQITPDSNGNPVATAPAPTWAAVQGAASAALIESDKTVWRCVEAAVALPTAWVTYRRALRAIVGASTGSVTTALPTKPAYPAGT